MADLSICKFKDKLTGGGAKSNLFKVIINFPAYTAGNVEMTSFLCKAASIPGSDFGEVLVPFRGREVPIPGDRTYEPWQITVLNGTDFAIHDAFLRWQNGINGAQSNKAEVAYGDYLADCVVQQLDRDETILKSYVMRCAWPKTVGSIELSFDNANTIEEFTVDMRYVYWDEAGNALTNAIING